jgi:hypothetical protein
MIFSYFCYSATTTQLFYDFCNYFATMHNHFAIITNSFCDFRQCDFVRYFLDFDRSFL